MREREIERVGRTAVVRVVHNLQRWAGVFGIVFVDEHLRAVSDVDAPF
jgi:hypothetical protein